MRPELNQRFCGRCGEPCGGFAGTAPVTELGRLCADCAIARLRMSIWTGRLITIALWILILALAVPALLFLAFLLAAITQEAVSGTLVLVSSLTGIVYAARRIRESLAHDESLVRLIRVRDTRPAAGVAGEGSCRDDRGAPTPAVGNRRGGSRPVA